MNDLSAFPNIQINAIADRKSNKIRMLERVSKHKHLQEFLERFKWNGLPEELNQDLIERILFYRFKGAMFRFNEKFYFLPFTLKGITDGGIDVYGRYKKIAPVLFTGQADAGQERMFLSGLNLKVIYSLNEELEKETLTTGNAVILTDTSLEISQDFLGQDKLINPIIEQMVNIIVLVNIDLVTSAKVFYIVAKDEQQKKAIKEEFKDLDSAILGGERVVVVTSALELQELTGASSKDTARYFQSYQSFDNIRKDIIGTSNGGTFMKQEHTTEMETQTNSNSGTGVYKNCLRMRKDFCKLINYAFGINVTVEADAEYQDKLIAEEGEQTKELRGDKDDVSQ